MKKIALILFIITSFSNAQITANPFEQGIITFRDNSTKNGEVKILDDKRTIRFRNKEQNEKNEYDHVKVKELEITKDGEQILYKYKIIAGEKPKLMRVINENSGKMNLYAIDYYKNWGSIVSLTNFYCHYYINKGNSNIVSKLGSSEIIFGSKHFKKMVKKSFKDCPLLLEKINNGEFKRTSGIEDIIDYYNENCGS
ncbi:hypothetical protein [Gaetbulibacter aestuarii]|uniref:Uncharacterized protein n=1 Tax=Gaetbulibacter aestuarii TaxID=1502358 RepID=A0ABW7N0F0_9FLAO